MLRLIESNALQSSYLLSSRKFTHQLHCSTLYFPQDYTISLAPSLSLRNPKCSGSFARSLRIASSSSENQNLTRLTSLVTLPTNYAPFRRGHSTVPKSLPESRVHSRRMSLPDWCDLPQLNHLRRVARARSLSPAICDDDDDAADRSTRGITSTGRESESLRCFSPHFSCDVFSRLLRNRGCSAAEECDQFFEIFLMIFLLFSKTSLWWALSKLIHN